MYKQKRVEIGWRSKLHLLLRPAVRRHYLQMKAMEAWDWGRIQQFQLEKLNRLLRHFITLDFYRQLLDEAGAPQQLDSLEALSKLPIIQKHHIRANLDAIAQKPTATQRDSTSGSTGQNFWFYRSPNVLTAKSAATAYCYNIGGVSYWDDFIVSVWGLSPRSGYFRKLSDRAKTFMLNQKVLISYGMDDTRALEYLRILQAKPPAAIVGYPNYLLHLAQVGTTNGLTPPSVSCLISSGETLFDETKVEIEAYFNAPVLNRYGTREFSNLAHQCSHQRGLHIVPSRCIIETDAEGNLLITDLDNDATPFIRYAVGDAGSLSYGKCSGCGRPFASIAQLNGRSHDIIRLASGANIPGQFWTTISRKVSGIDEFQVIQKAIDLIEFRIKVTDTYTSENDEILLHKIDELVQGECRVELVKVDHIEPTPVGKRRFIISELER